jgi:hypothetical protein
MVSLPLSFALLPMIFAAAIVFWRIFVIRLSDMLSDVQFYADMVRLPDP